MKKLSYTVCETFKTDDPQQQKQRFEALLAEYFRALKERFLQEILE